jgi:hypothetical protein
VTRQREVLTVIIDVNYFPRKKRTKFAVEIILVVHSFVQNSLYMTPAELRAHSGYMAHWTNSTPKHLLQS